MARCPSRLILIVMSEPSLELNLVNQRPRRCERCGCLAPFVEPRSGHEKRELHEIALRKEPMAFMARLRQMIDCDLASDKAVYAHITTRRRVCNRCAKSIPVAEYTDCPNCRSFNIWWGDAT